MNRALIAATAVALLIGVAGCGGGGGATTSGDEGKSKALVLLPSVQSESYVRQQQGALAEAKKHPDVAVQVDAGTGRTSATGLINKIETAVTKGVDVIAINPSASGNEVRPALQRAASQGVKVLAFDQTIPDFEQLAGYIEIDVSTGALKAGQFAAEELSAGDEFGAIRCFAGNPVMDARMDGFAQGMEGSDIEIVSALDAKCDPAKARTNMENMLTAHQGLDGVFSDTDLGILGALEALEAENKDLLMIGFDGEKAVLEDIANGGMIDATVTNPFEETGIETVRQAVNLAQGGEIPKSTKMKTGLVDSKQDAEEILREIDRLDQQGGNG